MCVSVLYATQYNSFNIDMQNASQSRELLHPSSISFEFIKTNQINLDWWFKFLWTLCLCMYCALFYSFNSCTISHMQSEDAYKNYWIIKQEVAPKIRKGEVWVLFTHAYTVWKGEWQMQSIYKGIYRQVIANENWS